MIKKVISGGQTGADRGGLDAAIACGIPHGGRCPKGRKAEDGIIPKRYHLMATDSGEYAVRTEANVKHSDVTIIFSYGRPRGGSALTVNLCIEHAKPYLVIDLKELSDIETVKMIVKWLKKNDDPGGLVLNVAGSRESQAAGIHDRVGDIMVMVLRTVV